VGHLPACPAARRPHLLAAAALLLLLLHRLAQCEGDTLHFHLQLLRASNLHHQLAARRRPLQPVCGDAQQAAAAQPPVPATRALQPGMGGRSDTHGCCGSSCGQQIRLGACVCRHLREAVR
jgi:hypothetical protein